MVGRGEGRAVELIPLGISVPQEMDHRVKYGSVVLNGFLGGHRGSESRKKEATG